MKNFSGFYINLNEAVERREKIHNQLVRCGLENIIHRYPTNRWTGAIPDGWTKGGLTSSEYGCWLSHIDLVSKQKDSHMVILEDDVVLSPGFADSIALINDDLIENNDILMLGYGFDYVRVNIVRGLLEIFSRDPKIFSDKSSNYFVLDCRTWYHHGCHALVINKKSRNKILDLVEQFRQAGVFLPIDLFYQRCFVEGRLKGSMLFPSLVAIDAGLPSQMLDRNSTKDNFLYITIANLFMKGISTDDILNMAQYFPPPAFIDPRVEILTRMYQYAFSRALSHKAA